MIITHIVSSLDSNQGGPPNVVLNFAEFQSKNGHNVNIVSQYSKIKDKNFNNLKNINLEKGNFLFKKHYIPNLNFIFKIYNNIKKSDIVHLHGVWNGVISVSSLISRILNKKVIMTPHGSLDSYNLNNKYLFKKIFYHFFEKFNLNYIQSFHFLNSNEYKNSFWVKNIKKKNILIQSNGYDLNYLKKIRIKKKTNKNKIEITYIGRLNKIKNIELQLDLLKYLLKHKNNYKLNIIGPDDGILDKLKKKAQELKLKKNVSFIKPIYGKEKYSIIKNSDIMILTSFYECNSILAIETMAIGGVLLCTRNCNLSHAGKYGAVKISDYKLKKLAKSVNYLSNQKNSNIIRKKSLKYAKENLDIEINMKKIQKFYNKIKNSIDK